MVDYPRCCEECGLPEDTSPLCEIECMLPSCLDCAFLIQRYGTGCGNIRVYCLCRDCNDKLMERSFGEP